MEIRRIGGPGPGRDQISLVADHPPPNDPAQWKSYFAASVFLRKSTTRVKESLAAFASHAR